MTIVLHVPHSVITGAWWGAIIGIFGIALDVVVYVYSTRRAQWPSGFTAWWTFYFLVECVFVVAVVGAYYADWIPLRVTLGAVAGGLLSLPLRIFLRVRRLHRYGQRHAADGCLVMLAILFADFQIGAILGGALAGWLL